ncbi:calmodulin-interacting protein 111-like isoform X2 [Musa acuminata AAA Group]|uniref:calmodulin-interacting protein 111-like isoform X2 n=1 Tax=Musa acuminata AAA Group TaxID=214697 RepID=UPI0031D4FADA
MPPKGKKSARASLPVAMASPSDRSPLFPGTPMDPSRGSPAGDDDEAVHRRLLAAAAAKFPALISEDRTFCGRITETESSPSNGSHARVWLSSAAMISTSIAPGSIVSVSFPASGKAYLNNFPLNTLAEECAPHFGSDVDGYMANRPGSYFAIASVFPSLKVLKDGVRLSWGLSCTIGSPDLGVLLHGPPGTGKTSLATSCARSVGASLFSINGPEVISEYYGESEQALREVFDSAKQAAPSVVFIDELDAIAPTRKEGSEELSLRIVATLLKLMDEINIKDRVLVIATTNRPDSIDPALRRPGRLDREIEIGVPSPEHRLDILCTLLNEIVHSLSIKEIQSLALGTHGFVGADLSALCNEAAMTALRRYIGHTCDPGLRKDEDVQTADPVDSLSSSLFALNMSSEQVASVSATRHLESSGASQRGSYESQKVEAEMFLKVTIEDFEKAKMKVRPSAMREVMLELPKVRWEDVGGQSMIKRQLIEAVQWPQICPDAFIRLGIRPPRGLLMIGPPGCSKTLMARAVASEAKLNFLAVKGPELFSKWVGESEKAVRSLFAKARANSPAIVFFDEIDGLAVTRGQDSDGTSVADRVLSQLLVEMDGLDQKIGVTVIAATNRPDKIDPALLRPGRFDRLLDVQPPDENDREDIFRIHMRKMPCSSDVSIKDLAQLTEDYTGADIKLICREAALAALEESLEISEVSMVHFKFGISRVQPSDLKFYRELAAQFQRLVDNQSARGE